MKRVQSTARAQSAARARKVAVAALATTPLLAVGAPSALASTSHQGRHPSSHISRHKSRNGARSSGRWLSIKEVGHLQRVGKGNTGFKLNEKGYASGTIKGTMYVELDVTAVNKATVSVSVYPKGGSVKGYAVASYYAHGAYAHFSGSLKITGGSGSFAGASGSGLKFSGTIKRTNDAATVTLTGRMHT